MAESDQHDCGAFDEVGIRPIGRRDFIRRAITLSASGIFLLSPYAWAARVPKAEGSNGQSRLIVVFLRGAVDGLNVVVPHGDSEYYDYRPTIAIPRAGEGAVINLDGHFGLHPALASMMPLWKERTLAFVDACGSPNPTRSHFEAQDYMQSGTPGVSTTPDGWMNRLLAELPGAHSPTEAISMGPTVPRILVGRMAVANVPIGRGAARPMPLDRPIVEEVFDRLYNGNDPMSRAYREGRIARKKLLADLEQDRRVADAGAPSPDGFSKDTAQLGLLMARDSSIRLAFMAISGWDTHVEEGSSGGQLPNHLKPLGEGLADLAKRLGPAYADTVIVVISEFGRTAHENGNAGTDHGHGNVMWVMGGRVRGGKIYGRWPGLSKAELYQERDLAITTDFRDPISEILHEHMGLSEPQILRVFPNRPRLSGNAKGIVRI